MKTNIKEISFLIYKLFRGYRIPIFSYQINFF